MGRNAQVRRARREQAADDRFMERGPMAIARDLTLKCIMCGRAWDRSCGEVVYSPAGSPPIGFNRRHYCTVHLGHYLLTRHLRARGMSKRDAAKEILRVIAERDKKAAAEAPDAIAMASPERVAQHKAAAA